MKPAQVNELLYQALETEIGGQDIYKNAIQNATTDELREEWTKYLEETEGHERILLETFEKLNLDPTTDTPGRQIVRHNGEALVAAMQMARKTGDPVAAELVAAECVVLAETKDHSNWELIGHVAKASKGDDKKALTEAFEQVEEQEDEHLYHTMGWSRELWLQSLGLPAVIPPPEEEKKVKTAIGAARAEQSRGDMLKGNGKKN
jgi:rubrerythrin